MYGARLTPQTPEDIVPLGQSSSAPERARPLLRVGPRSVVGQHIRTLDSCDGRTARMHAHADSSDWYDWPVTPAVRSLCRSSTSRRPYAIRYQGDREPVSGVDEDVEHVVRERLTANRHTEIGFLGEETGTVGDQTYWVHLAPAVRRQLLPRAGDAGAQERFGAVPGLVGGGQAL